MTVRLLTLEATSPDIHAERGTGGVANRGSGSRILSNKEDVISTAGVGCFEPPLSAHRSPFRFTELGEAWHHASGACSGGRLEERAPI